MFNEDVISELARNYGLLGGKWMMYPRIRAAGVFWNIIAPAVVNGQLTDSCVAAKISGPRDGRSTLSIYMNDFTDFEKIVALERAIRALKFKCDMCFKSDIHSQLAIYGATCHDFNVRDSLYESKFILRENRSEISRLSPH